MSHPSFQVGFTQPVTRRAVKQAGGGQHRTPCSLPPYVITPKPQGTARGIHMKPGLSQSWMRTQLKL